MKNLRGVCPLSILLLVATVLANSADVPPPVHGRISFDKGKTLIKGQKDADWSHGLVNTLVLPGDTLWIDHEGACEAELPGRAYVRISDASKAEITTLSPDQAIRGWAGSYYLQRLEGSSGSFTFETPACTVAVDPGAGVRVDVTANGSTTVTVGWGGARVHVAAEAPVVVGANTMLYVEAGYLPSEPVAVNGGKDDDFDRWNRDRVEWLAEGSRGLPASVKIPDGTLGVSDLNHYGEWVQADGRDCWRPTRQPNFVPYREGTWSYVEPVGNVWIGKQPFSYITSHYGRWHHHADVGWGWSYDQEWSPAWVAAVRSGPNYGWTPVDEQSRPVVVAGSASFAIGGLSFSLLASSFVPAIHLGDDYHYVQPCRREFFSSVRHEDIHIWNYSRYEEGRHFIPFDRHSISIFSEGSSRDYRGPKHWGRGKFSAGESVLVLEKTVHRSEFYSVSREHFKSERSHFDKAGHGKYGRSVHLSEDSHDFGPSKHQNKGKGNSSGNHGHGKGGGDSHGHGDDHGKGKGSSNRGNDKHDGGDSKSKGKGHDSDSHGDKGKGDKGDKGHGSDGDHGKGNDGKGKKGGKGK